MRNKATLIQPVVDTVLQSVLSVPYTVDYALAVFALPLLASMSVVGRSTAHDERRAGSGVVRRWKRKSFAL